VASGARRGEDLMTKAVQKITLSPSRDIPFDKLVLSQSNVRRIKAGVSVEELAEDITRRGLLQGLNLRPVLDEEKRLAKIAPITRTMWDADSDVVAIKGPGPSLAKSSRSKVKPISMRWGRGLNMEMTAQPETGAAQGYQALARCGANVAAPQAQD